jgi:hypothetical protein
MDTPYVLQLYKKNVSLFHSTTSIQVVVGLVTFVWHKFFHVVISPPFSHSCSLLITTRVFWTRLTFIVPPCFHKHYLHPSLSCSRHTCWKTLSSFTLSCTHINKWWKDTFSLLAFYHELWLLHKKPKFNNQIHVCTNFGAKSNLGHSFFLNYTHNGLS